MFLRDDNAQKSFSKLRSSIGGAYYWRVNNTRPGPDRQRMVKEAFVGKNLVITRFHARGRGRMSPIEKPFAQLTVVAKAQEEEAARAEETE